MGNTNDLDREILLETIRLNGETIRDLDAKVADQATRIKALETAVAEQAEQLWTARAGLVALQAMPIWRRTVREIRELCRGVWLTDAKAQSIDEQVIERFKQALRGDAS